MQSEKIKMKISKTKCLFGAPYNWKLLIWILKLIHVHQENQIIVIVDEGTQWKLQVPVDVFIYYLE